MTATTEGQSQLKAQDASTVDPSKLTALSPEVVSFACPWRVHFTHYLRLDLSAHEFLG